MWKSPRRIALASTAVVLTATGALGIAWLANWLPIRIESPESGELARSESGEYSLDSFAELPGGRFSDASSAPGDTPVEFLAGDDPIFADQSEPGFGSSMPGSMANSPAEAPWLLDSGPEQPTGPDYSGGERNSGADPSMPERFPIIAAGQRPALSGTNSGSNRLNLNTNPHEVVDRAAYIEGSSPSGIGLVSGEAFETTDGQVFRSDAPTTLSQARSFPAEVAFLDVPATSAAPGQSAPALGSSDIGNAGTEISPAPARPPAAVDLSAIDDLLATGDYVNAHRHLSTIYWNQPELQPAIIERLDRNADLIYFRSQPHFLEPYVVQPNDLLQRIAPRYRVNWEYLATVNNIDPRRIRAGQKLKVIKGPFSAFIDLSDFVLTVHCHGFYVKRFPIGIGKDGSTPTGQFTVLDRVPNPQYTDPNGRVIAGDDPANPLGDYWLDLGDSYGIHGTIEPDSIGKDASRGCIRMHNSDVKQIYNFLVRGSEVSIRP